MRRLLSDEEITTRLNYIDKFHMKREGVDDDLRDTLDEIEDDLYEEVERRRQLRENSNGEDSNSIV